MTQTPSSRAPRSLRLFVIGAAVVLVAAACGSQPASTNETTFDPETSGLATAAPSANPSPIATDMDEAGIGPCQSVQGMQQRVDDLRGVQLRVENRVTLDIELAKVQSAFAELERAGLGPLQPQLEDPLERLGYRLIDLEIAVEDFRTNRRVRPAAAHVETDATAMEEAVAGFAILARC